jgi:hypothetical protein
MNREFIDQVEFKKVGPVPVQAEIVMPKRSWYRPVLYRLARITCALLLCAIIVWFFQLVVVGAVSFVTGHEFTSFFDLIQAFRQSN